MPNMLAPIQLSSHVVSRLAMLHRTCSRTHFVVLATILSLPTFFHVQGGRTIYPNFVCAGPALFGVRLEGLAPETHAVNFRAAGLHRKRMVPLQKQ